MDPSKFATPDIMGPGTWFTIHMTAYKMQSSRECEFFSMMIQHLADNFKCMKCKGHFLKYIKDNPISGYRKQKYGMFRWSFDFHNAVNNRLGKPIVQWEDALAYYSDPQSGECDDCGTSHIDIPQSLHEYHVRRYSSKI